MSRIQELVARFRNDPPRPPEERRHQQEQKQQYHATSSQIQPFSSSQIPIPSSIASFSKKIPEQRNSIKVTTKPISITAARPRSKPLPASKLTQPKQYKATSNRNFKVSSVTKQVRVDSPETSTSTSSSNNSDIKTSQISTDTDDDQDCSTSSDSASSHNLDEEDMDTAAVLQSLRIKYTNVTTKKVDEDFLSRRVDEVLQKWSSFDTRSSLNNNNTNTTLKEQYTSQQPSTEISTSNVDPDLVIANIRYKYGLQRTNEESNQSVSNASMMDDMRRESLAQAQTENQSKIQAAEEEKMPRVFSSFLYTPISHVDAEEVEHYLKYRQAQFGGKLERLNESWKAL